MEILKNNDINQIKIKCEEPKSKTEEIECLTELLEIENEDQKVYNFNLFMVKLSFILENDFKNICK